MKTTITTAAQIVATTINNAKTDREGFVLAGGNRAIFIDFCGFKYAKEFPMGQDSFDPTFVAIFSDGSQLRVANGGQTAFPMFVNII